MTHFARSTYQARIKTCCSVEGEAFWRATRFIGQSPYVRESLLKQFPRIKDIETIIAEQKKGRYAFIKFEHHPQPEAKKYISQLEETEPRFQILSPGDAPTDSGAALVALIDQPVAHVKVTLQGMETLTPHSLFVKMCRKMVPEPSFATLREADDYNSDVLAGFADNLARQSRLMMTDLPMDRAFVGHHMAESTIEVREYNPNFAQNPIVERLATLANTRQPNTSGFAMITLSGMHRQMLQLEQNQVNLWKKYRRYHQTSDLPGERLSLANGGPNDWFTLSRHFDDTQITMPRTIRKPIEVTYEFYPYIDDEVGHLREMAKILKRMAEDGTSDWNFMNRTNNMQVAAFIDHLLTTGPQPSLDISMVDVAVNYLNARSPMILQPFESSKLLFNVKRLDGLDKLTSDGFLAVRQNGELSDIIYTICLKLTYFHATRKSPTGKYAIECAELFGPNSHSGEPNFVINSWTGESTSQPFRAKAKYLIFAVDDTSDRVKLFENGIRGVAPSQPVMGASAISIDPPPISLSVFDESQTPLVVRTPAHLIPRVKTMSPIASMSTMLRRECYSNAIQFGTGTSSASTEVLYGTVMAKGLLDVKVFLLLDEHPKT